MAVDTISATGSRVEEAKPKTLGKRGKNLGVRVSGARIYDSEHGNSCHQCRQKTLDFVAPCKGSRGGKSCTIKFCHKCLLNRYGEKAEEVVKIEDWNCPKCRGVCNCSFCRKKNNCKPTGNLSRTVKATGFSSVLEMLDSIGTKETVVEIVGLELPKRNHDKSINDAQKGNQSREAKTVPKKLKMKSIGNNSTMCITGSTQERKLTEGEVLCEASSVFTKKDQLPIDKKRKAPVPANRADTQARPPKFPKLKNSTNKELTVDACEGMGTVAENICNAKAKPLLKAHKPIQHCEPRNEEVVLPQGTLLTTVADVELSDSDVGPALQFLEFCHAFSKVLHLKKGEAGYILRELARGRARRRGVNISVIQFHINLLSMVRKDMGEKPLSYSSKDEHSWLEALGKLMNESQYALKEFPLDSFDGGFSRYDDLDLSTKLRILNFLCDETLGTEGLRSWIDKENNFVVEKNKEVSEKVLAAKKKEKDLKQKLKYDMAEKMNSMRNGGSLSISEYEKLIEKMTKGTEEAHTEMLESINLLSKKKQRPDAVRTEPVFLNDKGHAYWKLRGYYNGSNILFQDVEDWENNTLREKWFMFNEEDEKVVEKQISYLRKWRAKQKTSFVSAASDDKRNTNPK